MPTKIRPSQKESIKDATGRPTGMRQWKHFYLKQATTEEILKELKDGRKRNRNKLLNELHKRGVKFDEVDK